MPAFISKLFAVLTPIRARHTTVKFFDILFFWSSQPILAVFFRFDNLALGNKGAIVLPRANKQCDLHLLTLDFLQNYAKAELLNSDESEEFTLLLHSQLDLRFSLIDTLAYCFYGLINYFFHSNRKFFFVTTGINELAFTSTMIAHNPSLLASHFLAIIFISFYKDLLSSVHLLTLFDEGNSLFGIAF